MRNPKNLLVTTTSSLDGVIIKEYIKPVSAHVVAGTNFFSDFFASFSDVFGGRSNTYQRQLSSIYYEAIELLKQSAYAVGANCILGLKVDLDEISGKGKSMFMITATGTAVLVEKSEEPIHRNKLQNLPVTFSVEKIGELRKRKSLIELAKENRLVLDEPTWEFLTQNKVSEISKEILNISKSNYLPQFGFPENYYLNLVAYLNSLNEEDRTNLFYEYLMNEDNSSFTKILYKLIKELLVFDAKKIQLYLNDEKFENRIKALQIVVVDKPFFTRDDIPEYEKLIDLIYRNFPKKAKSGTTKKMLSSKEVEIWICECGNKNEQSKERCENCYKDMYGFTSDQISPLSAVKVLKENVDFIKNFTFDEGQIN